MDKREEMYDGTREDSLRGRSCEIFACENNQYHLAKHLTYL